MLTYSLKSQLKIPLYEQLYRAIKNDIITGLLPRDSKLPSKRSLASHLGISVVTVESSYQQLKAEGFIYSKAKRGFFVSYIRPHVTENKQSIRLISSEKVRSDTSMSLLNLSNNKTNPETFPFSIWSKLLRQVLNEFQEEIVHPSPSQGILPLREAIAKHLNQHRGMSVDPEQIIIGAGTEFLYILLIQLLGLDKTIALEEPSYPKMVKIYQQFAINQVHIPMENDGINTALLRETQADIVHISPSHQFPAGKILSISKRYDLLSWASLSDKHYIIEDDYDSEFCFFGLPIPSLQEIDSSEKVIYINTFNKSLASTLRISYMILPPHLLNIFQKKLSFYANTVSNLEQYTLASFMNQGYFDKHLNRMRIYYQKKRDELILAFRKSSFKDYIQIHEESAGLHFILSIKAKMSEEKLCRLLNEKGLNITPLSHYYINPEQHQNKKFIINYANISSCDISEIVITLAEIINFHD